MTPERAIKLFTAVTATIIAIQSAVVLLTIALKTIVILSSPLEATATHYADLIALEAYNNDIDQKLFAAIIKTESNFDPNAISSAGAKGLGQLMPIVSDGHCGGIDPFDVAQNLKCSAEYIRYLLDTLDGNETLAVAAYHGGIANVLSCMCIPRQIDQVYVNRVNQNKKAVVTARNYPSIVSALYGGAEYRRTQGWHGVSSIAGYDFVSPAKCGANLYAPMSGTVTMNGLEGVTAGGVYYVNTILIITNSSESVVLYHGNYSIPVGTKVTAGATLIGTEASNGWSTGCHTHLSYRINGVAQTYSN